MSKGSVYELDVFKVAYGLSIDIHKLSLGFPKIEQYGGIADQIRRASKSVCANLVEGLGKEASAMEQRRFVQIALGSARESVLWLKYARDLEYMDLKIHQEYEHRSVRVCQMLLGLKTRKEREKIVL